MPESFRTCATCGNPIPLDQPAGPCPQCLASDATLPLISTDGLVGNISGASSRELGAGFMANSQTGIDRTRMAPLPEELQPWFPGLLILELLGVGGMGAVYKARQPRLNRLVALKILTCPTEHHGEFAMRFEREAQVMARMNHPHIVTIFDFGEIDRSESGIGTMFYLLMEFVDGSDLNRLIHSGGMDPAAALAFVPQICDALQFAHDQGITHRDIKPANVLVDRKGHVKIADFGLAKLVQGDETLAMGLTMTGTAMGTPHYMAPEQWETPENVDHRADIYALGVVIYESLTGERPAGVFDPPSKKCKVDKRIDSVVMRAMEKHPERRYQQATEVKSAVMRVIERHPGHPAMRQGRRLWAGLIVAALAGVLGIAGWYSRTKPTELASTSDPRSDKIPSMNDFAKIRNAAAGTSSLIPLPSFPAGQWVKVLSTQTEMEADPVNRYKLKEGVRFVDGWMDATGCEEAPSLQMTGLAGKNHGVRLRGKIGAAPEKWKGFTIMVRTGKPGSEDRFAYQFALGRLDTTKPFLLVSHYSFRSKMGEPLAQVPLDPPLEAGDEFKMEFYVIGEKLIARFNDRYLPIASDSRLSSGEVFIQNSQFIRDLEGINLDGLTEAEAIRLIGFEGSDPVAVSPKPGRLRAAGTSADGKPHDLSRFDAYDDFVDVAGGWGGRWVALRKNGETISSDGRSDFAEISRIATSYHANYALISKEGKLIIPDDTDWKLPSTLEKGVVDAALGSQHGIALTEGGTVVVFGPRYAGVVGDPANPMGFGSPRWPMPDARILTGVKSITATATHAAALREDDSLLIWGWNGPVEWRADPRQKPLRQIRSIEATLWALDDADQLWDLELPRNSAENQPVILTGKPRMIEDGIIRMEEHCWCRENGEWISRLINLEGTELLKAAGIGMKTVFSLNGALTDEGQAYISLLWIEPSDG